MGIEEASATTLLSDLAVHRGSISAKGGYPLSAMAQTVDEAGAVVRDCGLGHLRFYSDRLMIGYFDSPIQTAGSIRDGWLYTGDMAPWEPDGPLRVTGRAG